MTTYKIIEATKDSAIGYHPFGGAADLWMCKAHEVIIIGAAETGKTRAALEKLDALMWKYPNAQAAMVRHFYADMAGSCIQTYENKVLGYKPDETTPVKKYGGEKAQFYTYPNGSRIWVGGLDRPGKVLSSERDFVYINQAEELELDQWEIILTRATGRAGNAPYAQVFGDANPSFCDHWMYERQNNGQLTLIQSRHEDNPTLFDQETGALTDQGKITISILDGLTGVRKIRLRDGKCANVEGQIWDYDKSIHLIDRFDIPGHWERIRVIDFGTVHPFVCGWWAFDEDRRMYLYRYIYMTNRTVTTHAKQIKELSEGEQISATICDHDAGDRLTLQENGITNIAAKKDVLMGIDKVNERFKLQVDGLPRIFILKDSLVEIDRSLELNKKPYSMEKELPFYIWANTNKEQPVKKEDDGSDMMRYAVMWEDGGYDDSSWGQNPFVKYRGL